MDLLAGRYELVELPGRGGHGAVHRAVQRPLGREVAVKMLLADIVGEEGARERFAREAGLVKRLEHPNTVRVATQVLKSLMEAHAIGIVHRDIKPSNVLLVDDAGERDFVKVLDFGVARVQGAPTPGSGRCPGAARERSGGSRRAGARGDGADGERPDAGVCDRVCGGEGGGHVGWRVAGRGGRGGARMIWQTNLGPAAAGTGIRAATFTLSSLSVAPPLADLRGVLDATLPCTNVARRLRAARRHVAPRLLTNVAGTRLFLPPVGAPRYPGPDREGWMMKQRGVLSASLLATVLFAATARGDLDDTKPVIDPQITGTQKWTVAFAVSHVMSVCAGYQQKLKDMPDMYTDASRDSDYLDWKTTVEQILKYDPSAPADTKGTRYQPGVIPAQRWAACQKAFDDYAAGVGYQSVKVSERCRSNVAMMENRLDAKIAGDLLQARQDAEMIRYKLTYGRAGIPESYRSPLDYSCMANDSVRPGFAELDNAFKKLEARIVEGETRAKTKFTKAEWVDTNDSNKAHVVLHFSEGSSADVQKYSDLTGWHTVGGGSPASTPASSPASHASAALPSSCTDARLGKMIVTTQGIGIAMKQLSGGVHADCNRLDAHRLGCQWWDGRTSKGRALETVQASGDITGTVGPVAPFSCHH